MKRPTTRIVLGLLLLIAAAFFFRRDARVEKPLRPPGSPPVAEPAPVEPAPVAAAPVAPKPPPPPPRPAPPVLKPVQDPEPGWEALKPGTIRGVVKVLGVPPTRKRARVDADPKCQAMQPAGMLRDNIVVDEANNLRWAFVYVASGVKFVPKGQLPPVLLDQVGCRFEPHVLGLRVNQPLNIYNNDRLLHNVHALPFDNREFNFGLPQPGTFQTKSFSKPEVMIKIKCDIHPWMEAWVGVLDHPYFSVTSETGGFGIVDLAPGRYVVKVWHEMYATVEREVDVPSGGDVRVDFFMDAKRN